jgi:hypothetical protein
MVGTHKAEPTLQEMKKKMMEQTGRSRPVRQPRLEQASLDDPLLARFGVKCLRSRYNGGVFVRNIPDYSRIGEGPYL